MASIAYICDIKMIDYHRLFGHQTMNFWRLTNAKQFTKFKQGDYLFFLAKGSEHPKTREKGLVGYGKLVTTTTCSVSKMWRTYQHLNGYENELDFKEAIKKASKQNILPKTLNGLFLDELVFFNSPLYLSEIDETVSRNLESFMYLDKEGVSLTLKILDKAKEIGINSWQFAIDHDMNESTFELDYIETLLSYFVLELFHPQPTLLKHHKQFIESHPQYKPVKEVKTVYFHKELKSCVIPISPSIKDEPFFAILGKAKLIQTLCEEAKIQVSISVYCQDWNGKHLKACESLGLLTINKQDSL
jgi:hypothetical protein